MSRARSRATRSGSGGSARSKHGPITRRTRRRPTGRSRCSCSKRLTDEDRTRHPSNRGQDRVLVRATLEQARHATFSDESGDTAARLLMPVGILCYAMASAGLLCRATGRTWSLLPVSLKPPRHRSRRASPSRAARRSCSGRRRPISESRTACCAQRCMNSPEADHQSCEDPSDRAVSCGRPGT